MKKLKIKQLLLISVPVAAALLSGCSEKKDTTTVSDISESVQEAGQKVADKSSEAWDKLKSATYDERKEVQSFVGDSAESLQNEVSSLMSKTGNKSSAAWDRAKSNYTQAQSELEEQLSKLSQSTEDNWDEVKSKTEEAWQNVEDAFMELKETLDASS